jgi:hypothetical protein
LPINFELEPMVLGFLTVGLLEFLSRRRSIIIPYVPLPSRPDRFYGDPEVEVEIGGKRTHMRLDTGNAGDVMLLKKTADYLEIRRKFHPLRAQSLDPISKLAASTRI